MPTRNAPDPSLDSVRAAAEEVESSSERGKAKRNLQRMDDVDPDDINEDIVTTYLALRKCGFSRPRAEDVQKWGHKRRATVEAGKIGKTVRVVIKSTAPNLEAPFPKKVFVDPRT
eukprot:522344-Pyramimonas_sp.AAC.1